MKPKDVATELAKLTDHVYHYFALPNDRLAYITWQEDATTDFWADNHAAERGYTMSVDLFTRTENDALMDSIPDTFDTLGVGYSVESVDYEDDTRYIHVTWSLSLHGGSLPEPEVVDNGNT